MTQPDENDVQVRMYDKEADAAGLTATAAFDHLDKAMKAAESKGLSKRSGLKLRRALCLFRPRFAKKN